MCLADDLNRKIAEAEAREKEVHYGSQMNLYNSKGAYYQRGKEQVALGASRGFADLQSQAVHAQGQTKLAYQKIATDFYRKDFVDEGGRDIRRKGRIPILELLAKKSAIEAVERNSLPTSAAYYRGLLSIARASDEMSANARENYGLPPAPGFATTYTPQSIWERAQPAINLGLMIAGLPGGSDSSGNQVTLGQRVSTKIWKT